MKPFGSINRGQLDRADVVYRQLLRQDPAHPDALHLCGVVAHQRGQHHEAIQKISRALELMPDQAVYLSNLGTAQLALGQISEAIKSFSRASELDPRYADARYNLANALHKSGDLDAAATAYRTVLQFHSRIISVRSIIWEQFCKSARIMRQPSPATRMC